MFRLESVVVDLVVVLLLKSSARCTSDGATSSSVRGALEKWLVMVDAMVAKIYIVVRSLFTKKERIEGFEELHGGVRTRPN
jgi:hypothetical protein